MVQAEVASRAATSGSARRAVIWAVPSLVIVAFLPLLGVVALTDKDPADIVFDVATGTALTILALVGAVLADRAPANRIGAWLLVVVILLTAGVALGSYGAAGQAATPNAWPGASAAAAVRNFPDVFAIGIILIWIPAIFPGGTLLSARWRYLIGLSVVALMATCVSMLVVGSAGADPGSRAMADAISSFSSLIMVTCAVGALSAVVIRFRRGSPIERQQTKWFLAAAAFAVVAFPMAFAFPPNSLVGIVLFMSALFAAPLAIGIAVLRFRLYAIDRIVSRTTAYLLITGVLAAVYVGVVLGLRAVVGEVAGGGTAGVVVSTLVVASLFQPLRHRVQSAVDRRFNRHRYDAERTVGVYAGQLRDEVHLDAVVGGLAEAVRVSVAPTASGIWIRRRGLVRP